MLTLRKAADRGHFDFGWLDTAHTFSFAECGIQAGGSTWSFEVFVLPLAATGRLEGTYEYRLNAEVN